MRPLRRLWEGWLALFAEDEPEAPRYDPVHLGAAFLSVQIAAAGLFWLLWTLLVYEGGLPAKLAALSSGARGPEAYEGWRANAAALIIGAGLVAALRRLARGPAPRR